MAGRFCSVVRDEYAEHRLPRSPDSVRAARRLVNGHNHIRICRDFSACWATETLRGPGVSGRTCNAGHRDARRDMKAGSPLYQQRQGEQVAPLWTCPGRVSRKPGQVQKWRLAAAVGLLPSVAIQSVGSSARSRLRRYPR